MPTTAPAWQARDIERSRLLNRIQQSAMLQAQDRSDDWLFSLVAYLALVLRAKARISLPSINMDRLLGPHVHDFVMFDIMSPIQKFGRTEEEKDFLAWEVCQRLLESAGGQVEGRLSSQSLHQPFLLYQVPDRMQEVEVPEDEP